MEGCGGQAMADSTLARSCPYESMTPVLAIVRWAAAASNEAALTPLERVVYGIATGPRCAFSLGAGKLWEIKGKHNQKPNG